MKTNKRLYIAYGSNLNIEQMKYRCPGAKIYGTGVIRDYELQFKGRSNCAFATIAPKKGSEVPVAVWEISPKNERSLDSYEGYPSHYFKKDLTVSLENEEVKAMVYIMNLKMRFGLPDPSYYNTVLEGYKDCGLDKTALEQAVMESTLKYYNDPKQRLQYSLFEYDDDENEEISEDEEPTESDPFYFSEGMNL